MTESIAEWLGVNIDSLCKEKRIQTINVIHMTLFDRWYRIREKLENIKDELRLEIREELREAGILFEDGSN